jgi:hypothetical protein
MCQKRSKFCDIVILIDVYVNQERLDNRSPVLADKYRLSYNVSLYFQPDPQSYCSLKINFVTTVLCHVIMCTGEDGIEIAATRQGFILWNLCVHKYNIYLLKNVSQLKTSSK